VFCFYLQKGFKTSFGKALENKGEKERNKKREEALHVRLAAQVSTKASRQSTLGYTHGNSLSADRCASYELDGDARHRQGFYPGSAAVWA